MYTKKDLKQFKLDLVELEAEVIKDFELSKISSSTTNRYTIDTIYGKYNFYFDNDSIFGKFEDITPYLNKLPDYTFYHNRQRYEYKHKISANGKLNFHYNDIYDFQSEIYKISLKFKD